MARYVGKRIVPKHCGYWDNTKTYEMENIVYNRASGNSYMSRKAVPAGTDISQEEYWALCLDFNMQMDLLEKHFTATEQRIVADNDATEQAIRADNDETEQTILADNQATRTHVDENLATTTTELTQRVTTAQNAMSAQKASFDATAEQLNARMNEVLAAGTGEGQTEILDARVDAEGNAYETLGSHIRDILPKAQTAASELFTQKMTDEYEQGIFEMRKYNLHENKLCYAYTTSSFSGWFSEYVAPADLTVTELKFYIKAREHPVTKIRVSIALGERTDAALCFQTDLSANIEPEEEEYVSCPISRVILQQGEIIYVGVQTNTPCSQGFGYEDNATTVSWYSSFGSFRSLENHSDGSHKKLYFEMYGFITGLFSNHYLHRVSDDHETRLQEVEKWKPLVDQFSEEDIYINKQNPLPVIRAEEKYNYSSFTGWTCSIGHPTDFDTLIFSIKNRSAENYLENVRCFIAKDNKDGEMIVDEVMSDVHISPGEWRQIEFHFSQVIENIDQNELYAGFACDQHVSFMGGSTGIILRPPTTGDVLRYNASVTPSYSSMIRKLTYWDALADPDQNNTSKIDFIIAKQSQRYSLGEFEEPVREIAINVVLEQIEEAISEKTTFELPPRVVLPDVFHAVVGDTLQLFYRGIIEHPYPYLYNIDFHCDIGKNVSRYYEVTPETEQVGDHRLAVNVRDHLDHTDDVVVRRYDAVGRKTKRGPVEALELKDDTFAMAEELEEIGDWNIDKLLAQQDKYFLKYQASDVRKIPLGEVAEIFRGKSVSKKDTNGAIGVVNITNIGQYEIDYDSLDKLDEEERKVQNYILQDGDVLLPARGTAIRTAVFEKQSYPCIASSNVIVIRPRGTMLNSTYLKIFIDSPIGNSMISSLQQGMTVMNISYKDLKLLEVPFPALTEQEKVASEYEEAYKKYTETISAAEKQWAATLNKLQNF